jgi:RNA polymerase sigma-70 factor (ECF subfamily)
MDEPRDEFQRLLKEAVEGSKEAMQTLIDVYTPHILRAVRRKLNKSIRSKFDSIDFTQAVWASFLTDIQEGEQFQQPEDLAAYLWAMAEHKVVDEIRHHLKGDNYNVEREQSLNDSRLFLQEGIADRTPTPSQVVAGEELWERLMERLPEHYRKVLELRRAGHSHVEIAQQLGLHEKTVRRVIQTLWDGWLSGPGKQ